MSRPLRSLTVQQRIERAHLRGEGVKLAPAEVDALVSAYGQILTTAAADRDTDDAIAAHGRGRQHTIARDGQTAECLTCGWRWP